MASADVGRSSDFYHGVFGWRIRKRTDGSIAFDDTTEQVSGSWIVGRAPAASPDLLFLIIVDSVADTLTNIVANGARL